MSVKTYKFDGEEFTVTESFTNGDCELEVEGLGRRFGLQPVIRLTGMAIVCTFLMEVGKA